MWHASGETIAQYRLIEPVGEGLETEVWRADDVPNQREVAIKVYVPWYGQDRPFVSRFVRRMQTVARLNHPNVQPVYHAGTHDDWTYLVGPYVADGSLEARLTGRPWPISEAVQLLAGLAAGLDYIHQHDVVHQNLKPSNVLLNGTRPVLGDVLVDRPLDYSEGDQLRFLVDLAEYAAPERLADRDSTPTGHLSDLYSLGVLAYVLLTGRPPFTHQYSMSVFSQHITTPPPPARGINPDLPATVEEVLTMMLAKDPQRRFASGAAFVNALRFASKAPASRSLDGPSLPGSTTPFQVTQPATSRVQRWRRL